MSLQGRLIALAVVGLVVSNATWGQTIRLQGFLSLHGDPTSLNFKGCDPKLTTCATNMLVAPGYVETDGTVHTEGCHVLWGYNGLVVPNNVPMTLQWTILKGPTDSSTYEFGDMEGITVLSRFDRSKDLDNEGFGKDRTIYQWLDLNKRPREDQSPAPAQPDLDSGAIRFKIVVYRILTDKTREMCVPIDPVIINKS